VLISRQMFSPLRVLARAGAGIVARRLLRLLFECACGPGCCCSWDWHWHR